ncbi:MAG: carboxymuconolactone decarboxylase family protein [Synergistaceae bacterium]|nr:carboxymuconolactone decarboxylase family protein [Synergistaceae bacterium]
MQMKYLLMAAALIFVVGMTAGRAMAAEARETPAWALEAQKRDRAAQGRAKFAELFKGGDGAYYTNGEELAEMMNNFVYGDIYQRGKLTDRQRELITLSVMTTNQTLDELKAHVKASLNVGLTPEEIKEAVYQCAPYIGFSKALAAANKMNEAFREKNVKLPVESQATVTERDRCEKGFQTQASIFPPGLDGMYRNSPENRKHMAEYLASFCFGDFYTRGALDLKTREILTLCIISAQGGCDSQVRSHVQGNLNVGNDEDTIIEAITQCLPYMGFPRTLNALACAAEVIKK